MTTPYGDERAISLDEASRQLELAVHDAQVAFDCIALGNIDRAHTNALTARAAVDAAETMLRAALSGADLVVDTGGDGADEADEAVDAQPDEAFEAFGPGTDEAFDAAGASDVRLPASEPRWPVSGQVGRSPAAVRQRGDGAAARSRHRVRPR